MAQLEILCIVFLAMYCIYIVNIIFNALFLNKLFKFSDRIGKLGFLTEMFNGPTADSMRHVPRVKIHIERKFQSNNSLP